MSEYLVDRMIRAGASKLCFVVSPEKSDIVEYYGGAALSAQVCYAVQPQALGLCDALFRALPMISPEEEVAVGLPDTVWFPEDGLALLPRGTLSFLLFPVSRPEFFDAVVADETGAVREIQVKRRRPDSSWIWGAFRMPGSELHRLHALWRRRDPPDEYLGTLINAYLAEGGQALGIFAGTSYVDVGTLSGYREALELLARHDRQAAVLREERVP